MWYNLIEQIVKGDFKMSKKKGKNNKKQKNVNAVLFPIRRYATLECPKIIANNNFDDILRKIGKFYYNLPDDISLNRICSIIKDEINKKWHLNRLRKRAQFKNVTTNQIKSIRFSYTKLMGGPNYIRIPFNVVPILFFILYIYKKTYLNNYEEDCIGNYFYKEHRHTAIIKLPPMIAIVGDPVLALKYNTLLNDLNGNNSLLDMYLSDLAWDDYYKDMKNKVYKI